MTRQAALALDQFDHRRFFAADVGAGAAAHMDLGVLRQAGPLDLADLFGKKKDHFRIFVANVKISIRSLHDPRCDQHALDETVRVAFEIVTVLERAGLALVAIDRKQPRRRFGAHQRPFPAGRKAGAAKAA